MLPEHVLKARASHIPATRVEADASRRAGGDQGAGKERYDAGNIADDGVERKDEIAQVLLRCRTSPLRRVSSSTPAQEMLRAELSSDVA